jgi:hypothetical protein
LATYFSQFLHKFSLSLIIKCLRGAFFIGQFASPQLQQRFWRRKERMPLKIRSRQSSKINPTMAY